MCAAGISGLINAVLQPFMSMHDHEARQLSPQEISHALSPYVHWSLSDLQLLSIAKYLELEPAASDVDMVKAHMQGLGKPDAVEPELEPL